MPVPPPHVISSRWLLLPVAAARTHASFQTCQPAANAGSGAGCRLPRSRVCRRFPSPDALGTSTLSLVPRRSWPCALLGAAACVRLLPVQVLVVSLSSLLLLLVASPLSVSFGVPSCRTMPTRTMTASSCVIPVGPAQSYCSPARSEPRPLSPATARCFCAAAVWSCPDCTLENESRAEACAACNKHRPGASGCLG